MISSVAVVCRCLAATLVLVFMEFSSTIVWKCLLPWSCVISSVGSEVTAMVPGVILHHAVYVQ